MAEFPFAVLQYQRSPQIKTLSFSDTITGKDGSPVVRRWTVTGSDAHGLPVAGDVDIVIGLLALAQEQGMKSREVYFSRYDLLRIMRWGQKGRNYDRIKQGLDRLTGTTIKAERAFYDKRKQAYLTRSFHLIDDYDLWDRARDGDADESGDLPLKSCVTWNRHIFRSIKAGYVKRLDTERYFRLSNPIAKQLFRYLDKKLYRHEGFQIELFKLCHEHLGVSRGCRHVSKFKERLEPSLRELIQDGYLRAYRYVPSKSKRKSFNLQFSRAAQADRVVATGAPAAYFYTQLLGSELSLRSISERERGLADSFVRRHGFDVFREFVDFVMREKPKCWPSLATLSGAFQVFETPFISRLGERELLQHRLRQELQSKQCERRLIEDYALYVRSVIDRKREEGAERYAEFERMIAANSDYQRAGSILARYVGNGGPLAKAVRESAERTRESIVHRLFVQFYSDQGALDFEAWRTGEIEATSKNDRKAG